MSSITSINSNGPYLHQNNEKKIENKEKSSEKTEGGKIIADRTLAGQAAETSKMIIELNLKIQIETKKTFSTQSALDQSADVSKLDLSQFFYNDKPVTELSQEEAEALVSADGYFGIEQTAQRIFEFASSLAGESTEGLRAAREGIIQGFKEAQSMFGVELPDISHSTLNRALELMDAHIGKLGGSVIDIKA
ncbi:hydrogenase-4 component G [bacterium]|nr:hydrogenase-4 component G [bacterium]